MLAVPCHTFFLQLNILLRRKSHVVSPSPQSTEFRQSPDISRTDTTSTTSLSAACVSNKKGSGHPRAAGAPSEDEDNRGTASSTRISRMAYSFNSSAVSLPKPAPYCQEKSSLARSEWLHDHRYPFSSTSRMRIRVATLTWRRSLMYLHRRNQPLSYRMTLAHLQPPTYYYSPFHRSSSNNPFNIRETSIMQTGTSMPSNHAVGRSHVVVQLQQTPLFL